MSKTFSLFSRAAIRPYFRRLMGLTALIMLFAWNLPAQNVTINTASFSNLVQALTYSGTNATRTVSCQFNGTITVTSPIFITGNIFLVAPTNFNVTISGSPGVRIFEVINGVTFTVSNLVISAGNSLGTNGVTGTAGANGSPNGFPGSGGSSGGPGLGGAIYNLGTNYAYNCIFLTNTAVGAVGGAGGAGGNGNVGTGGKGGSGGNGGNGGAGQGGAIYNSGMLVLSNCTFSGNGAIGATGGAGGTNGAGILAFPGAGGAGGVGEGAGVYNVGRANIQACTFDFNFAEGGASQTEGTSNDKGVNGLDGALGLGGGVFNGGTNTNVIVNCTFDANLAVGGTGGNGGRGLNSGYSAGLGGNGGNAYGGGLFNATGGTIMVTNCTFANGAVFGGTNGQNGSVGATNFNSATMGQELGANIANGGTFHLKNSILAYPTNGGNASGDYIDEGFNISSDATPITIVSTTITNTDPLLLPLGNNGGPTLTFDLEPQLSPALNAITDGRFPRFDQRGFSRPINDADIGAVQSGIPTFFLSGHITPASNIYTGVIIDVTGGSGGLTYSTSPDNTGFYFFSNTLPADTYTIVPQPTNGFNFTPADLVVTLADTNAVSLNNDFTATASYTIGGVISNLTAAASVVIFATTNGTNTPFQSATTTNTIGLYNFTNVPVGNFTIVPQQTASVAFNPPSLSVFVSGNNTNNNFFAVLPTYSISGQITGGTGPFTVFANIGGSTLFASTQTDSAGNYSFSDLTAGAYTFVPQPTNGFSFTPVNISLTVPPSTNNENFVAQGTATFSIGGQITNYHAVVPISAVFGSTNSTINTDANGKFTFSGLTGGNYTVTPAAVSGLTFRPSSLLVPVGPSATGEFFAAVPSVQPTNFAPKFTNQTFDFSLGGFPNLTYRIQASSDLINWSDISTNTASTGGALSISTSTAGFTNRFFRAVTP